MTQPQALTKPFSTLLLTGAAGTLGRALAPTLTPLCDRLLLSDLPERLARAPVVGGAHAAPCDLADPVAVGRLLQGVDAVVHLGGISVERPFEEVLQANIRGVFHLYEAARRHGTRRIVFASSNHVTGCYDKSQTISPQDPPRPDGYYGLSKLYGEGLASLYWDRHGIETVCLRIGSALPQPRDHRGLHTWLSLPDLGRLVLAALTAPNVGFLVAYGISNNTRRWWDTKAAWDVLGYQPQDDSELFAPQVQHVLQPEGTPSALKQGGVFLDAGPFDDHQDR
ncbi:MAG TPA: NAD(P)-dependent oxidoreductase [Rubrivivax sp.]|nr:NAD(P)-dependent oxidoreductase [Rubrivivax sp.]